MVLAALRTSERIPQATGRRPDATLPITRTCGPIGTRPTVSKRIARRGSAVLVVARAVIAPAVIVKWIRRPRLRACLPLCIGPVDEFPLLILGAFAVAFYAGTFVTAGHTSNARTAAAVRSAVIGAPKRTAPKADPSVGCAVISSRSVRGNTVRCNRPKCPALIVVAKGISTRRIGIPIGIGLLTPRTRQLSVNQFQRRVGSSRKLHGILWWTVQVVARVSGKRVSGKRVSGKRVPVTPVTTRIPTTKIPAQVDVLRILSTGSRKLPQNARSSNLPGRAVLLEIAVLKVGILNLPAALKWILLLVGIETRLGAARKGARKPTRTTIRGLTGLTLIILIIVLPVWVTGHRNRGPGTRVIRIIPLRGTVIKATAEPTSLILKPFRAARTVTGTLIHRRIHRAIARRASACAGIGIPSGAQVCCI